MAPTKKHKASYADNLSSMFVKHIIEKVDAKYKKHTETQSRQIMGNEFDKPFGEPRVEPEKVENIEAIAEHKQELEQEVKLKKELKGELKDEPCVQQFTLVTEESPDSTEHENKKTIKKLKLSREVWQAPLEAKLDSRQNSQRKPFVAHPLSRGEDFRMLYAATYLKKEKKNINMDPFIVKKPFFPDFVDPVPPNHKFAFEKKAEPQSNVITSSVNIKKAASEERPMAVIQPGPLPIIDEDIQLILETFFDGLCPRVIFEQHGCNEIDCVYHSHDVPNPKHLEEQLLKCSVKDSNDVYSFVLKFPSELRDRFIPAIIEVGAKRHHEKLLEMVISDALSMETLEWKSMLSDYIEPMERHGWTKQAAIKLLIDCQDGTQAARDEVVKVIVSSGPEIVNFFLNDYLRNIRGKIQEN